MFSATCHLFCFSTCPFSIRPRVFLSVTHVSFPFFVHVSCAYWSTSRVSIGIRVTFELLRMVFYGCSTCRFSRVTRVGSQLFHALFSYSCTWCFRHRIISSQNFWLGWFWLAPASFFSFHSSPTNYFSPAVEFSAALPLLLYSSS